MLGFLAHIQANQCCILYTAGSSAFMPPYALPYIYYISEIRAMDIGFKISYPLNGSQMSKVLLLLFGFSICRPWPP